MEQINKVYLSREFSCQVDELFEWVTKPALLSQWFGPKHFKVLRAEADLAIGGWYRIELVKPNGDHFFIKGEYLEIDQPTKLAFSFSYEGLVNAPPDSVVEIRLDALSATASKLLLIQRFQVKPPDMETRTATWEYILSKLAECIINGNPNVPG